MGKRRIMLDTRKVTSIDSAVTQRFWAAKKHPEPMFAGDKPWELYGPMLYGTVLHDQGRYRMWYNPWPDVPPVGNSYYVAYAESSDGLHWEKPELDIQPYQQFTRTNLTNLIRHNPSVMLDRDDPDPAKRYKAMGYVRVQPIQEIWGVTYPGDGYYLAHSPNGLHWTEFPATAPLGTPSDVGNFIRDEPRGRYFGSVKESVRYDLVDRRSVAVMESADFQNWTRPKVVLVADALDDIMARQKGLHHAEFYGMALDPYDDFMVGLLWIYWTPLPFHPLRRTGWWGYIDCHLAYSYDRGEHWLRTPDRQPLIPAGERGELDRGAVYTSTRPIPVGDELWIYYSGCRRDHAWFAPLTAARPMQLREDVDWSDPKSGDENTVLLAKLRKDGYASLSTDQQGSFVIAHGIPDGSRLLVNARTPYGSVKAQVLDAAGNPIAGFGVEDCIGFTGDSVRGEIRWQHRSLAELPPDREIRLRFLLDDADLFAYELANS